jgi:hypothetical protein
MNAQALLTIAAIVGPLIGVGLGAFLASRFQERHWFRDRRFDAFVEAQAALFRVLSGIPGVTRAAGTADAHDALKGLDDAVTKWGDARGRLVLLAGTSVESAAAALHETLTSVISAAMKRAREVTEAAIKNESIAADTIDWDQELEAIRALRKTLTDSMRKELRTR